MALLLFIIALDCVYKRFRHRDDITVIPLRSSTREVIIAVSGDTDDTVVYICRRSEIPKVIEDFWALEKSSCLSLKKYSSIIVVIGQNFPCQLSALAGLLFQGPLTTVATSNFRLFKPILLR